MWDRLGLVEPFFSVSDGDHTESASTVEEALVLVKLGSWAAAAAHNQALGTANKNFIGIVEGEQRTADQSTSNLRLNEIGVPWLFHPCSRSICQACATNVATYSVGLWLRKQCVLMSFCPVSKPTY